MKKTLTTRRGISMAETILSTIIVGFVLVSTLQIVGPMVRSTSVHADRLVAANLANELTEEVGMLLWTTPDTNSPNSIGLEATETRVTFDDIDDFNGWASSPPMLSTGQLNTRLTGWTRSVIVDHVLLSDATTTSGSFTGLKRVTVIVSKNGIKLAQTSSLHSQSADTLGFIVQP
jgi:hypothetical protein